MKNLKKLYHMLLDHQTLISMESQLLDTNVIIRVLVQDWWDTLIQAKKYISNIEEGKYRWVISSVIVAECVYVLWWPYKLKRKVITTILQMFFLTKNLFLEEGEVVYNALWIFEERNLDFADCYLIAKNKKKKYSWILSFDNRLNTVTWNT